ncbi:MAG: class I SAM-dependent methyltransferase [Acidimicrobiales bacterium]|nr:class I SAM-dependent methyltransferase [Acidimicrobiales bacterium]
MSTDGDFFEEVYARADGDEGAIPWQDAPSRPLFDEWWARQPERPGGRALVVAAGLGDDAVALTEKGYVVTAFDASPSAVDWARRRHPDAPVAWEVADLLHAPAGWRHAFDLVVEVFTVQSIDPDLEVAAAEAIRSFVAPGGTLLAIALVGDPTGRGRPWPLAAPVVDALCAGLRVVDRRAVRLDPATEVVRFELERPA